MQLEYFTVDVFTDRIFSGNQLAVVPRAEGIAEAMMQAIAKEFNYSETVFVLPATDAKADCRLRIFTPGSELPFAGHPTIGTAVLLAELGILTRPEVVLQEGVGNVPVRISRNGGAAHAELTVPNQPEFRADVPAPDALASVIGLKREDLDPAPGSIAAASSGVPFILARVRDTSVLARAGGNESAWRTHLAGGWAQLVYVYTVESDGSIRARMFAPWMGIPEDPATGGGAAALAACLASVHPDSDGEQRRVILQGVEMGRPSRIEIGWTKKGGAIHSVRVGGYAVRVAAGTMTLPSAS
ncbi:MAG TPA: PhzF family phenazine biosynthesis protein [Gemmatimonadales bacterium]|nr:PhzF family phenazine biosynthesis protein [Gemmatimonadales bacterium]